MKIESNHRGERGRRILLIGIFSHIEVYPPSLNALYHLAPMFDEVVVLVRNVWKSNWQYPQNVRVVTSGRFVPLEKVGHNSLVEKVNAYLTFGASLRRLYKLKSPAVVLLYDAAAFSLFNLFVQLRSGSVRPLVWYHNHDVSVEHEVGKFSLMRLMKRLEMHYFAHADIFSLPNQVRLKYFPLSKLKSSPFIIPNYPSHFFFGKWRRKTLAGGDKVRLIFQGHISPSNRIDEFVRILSATVDGHEIELHLAGPIHPEYRNALEVLAESLSVQHSLFLYGRIPYSELPALTSSCHIGLAVYGLHNTMVRTMSTASNKIFEYASVGLPVVINDRRDLREEFEHYPWIHFMGYDRAGLLSSLETIVTEYSSLSASARKDFEDKLNFEAVFQPIKISLEEKLRYKQW